MDKKRIGFISFRFAGTDGVTLETLKWVEVLEKQGHECFFCCGESSMDEDKTMLFPEMHFNHPNILEITEQCFSSELRSSQLTAELHNMRRIIKQQLYTFINTFQIELLIPENLLAIPMNIPFSMALVEVIAETRIPTISHHHDFYWERPRYRVNCVQDILRGCFPPDLPYTAHVVINSIARGELGYRCGVSSVIVPNVMDFHSIPKGKDEYNATIRSDLGIDDDTLLILQPTRVVQRKGIEHAIELIRRLERKSVMVISHESGDEGSEYKQRVLEFADMLQVEVTLCADIIAERRGTDSNGKKLYDLNDIYAHADLITYPSLIEGFGNALLETYYYKRPVVINRYPVYAADIRTKGVKGVEFYEFITSDVVDQVNHILENQSDLEDMVQTNYAIGKKYFSYELLDQVISHFMYQFFGV